MFGILATEDDLQSISKFRSLKYLVFNSCGFNLDIEPEHLGRGKFGYKRQKSGAPSVSSTRFPALQMLRINKCVLEDVGDTGWDADGAGQHQSPIAFVASSAPQLRSLRIHGGMLPLGSSNLLEQMSESLVEFVINSAAGLGFQGSPRQVTRLSCLCWPASCIA